MAFARRAPNILKVDHIEVFRNSGIDEGIISAFCTYFVFNLAYPRHLKNTLMFLQRYIAKIVVDGDQPLPITVTRQINLLYWLHHASSIPVPQMLQEDKVNKPVQLSERLQHVGITGSASQKWCLFRLLPFVMAHRVPPDCKYWHVFLLCREITEIVMAPKVRREPFFVKCTCSRVPDRSERCVWGCYYSTVSLLSSLFKTDTNVWAPAFAMVHEIWGQAPIF